jgi:hypothetical protein
MLTSLNKLKTILTRYNKTPKEKVQVAAKPERVAVVPMFARSRPLGSTSEKLHFHFCKDCPVEPELLAVRGTVCLLGCEKVGCQKRLFRIETDKISCQA